MKNYKNDLFEFAWSAERSIEDGIDELSASELPTIVISYIVMFLYILVALGKIKSFKTLLVNWFCIS